LVAACGSRKGDPHSVHDPDPLGQGLRIRDVQAPGTMNPPSSMSKGATVDVSSVVVTAIDTFDETNDGKSRGTIYLQDEDQALPLSGIATFAPSFQPSNLRLFPGDVVDVRSAYVELTTLGSTVDFTKTCPACFLPQFDHPAMVFRTETTNLPKPVVIDVLDLFDFTKGRKWAGMLVTIQDVLVPAAVASKGRVTYPIAPSQNAPAISNELYDLAANPLPEGATLKSVTGVVTFFFNLKIAPRSGADIVP
jgi:hypothetical protein